MRRTNQLGAHPESTWNKVLESLNQAARDASGDSKAKHYQLFENELMPFITSQCDHPIHDEAFRHLRYFDHDMFDDTSFKGCYDRSAPRKICGWCVGDLESNQKKVKRSVVELVKHSAELLLDLKKKGIGFNDAKGSCAVYCNIAAVIKDAEIKACDIAPHWRMDEMWYLPKCKRSRCKECNGDEPPRKKRRII